MSRVVSEISHIITQGVLAQVQAAGKQFFTQEELMLMLSRSMSAVSYNAIDEGMALGILRERLEKYHFQGKKKRLRKKMVAQYIIRGLSR